MFTSWNYCLCIKICLLAAWNPDNMFWLLFKLHLSNVWSDYYHTPPISSLKTPSPLMPTKKHSLQFSSGEHRWRNVEKILHWPLGEFINLPCLVSLVFLIMFDSQRQDRSAAEEKSWVSANTLHLLIKRPHLPNHTHITLLTTSTVKSRCV